MPLTGLPCLVSLRSWPDHFPASPPTENPFLDHGTDLSSSRWPGPGRNCFAGDRHIDRHPFSAVQRVASKHPGLRRDQRSEEHTSELQSLMRTSSAVFCLKTKTYEL